MRRTLHDRSRCACIVLCALILATLFWCAVWNLVDLIAARGGTP